MIPEYLWLGLLFAVVYVLTIWPSWKLLARILARSASSHKLTMSFWFELFIYRLLIALPYILLLVAGKDTLSQIVKSLVIGIVVFGLIFSFVRIFLRKSIVEFLWILYGYTYDGLLYFYPYRSLIDKVVARVAEDNKFNGRILELGSGTGNVLVKLKDAFPGATLVGVDLSPTMMSVARKKLIKSHNVLLQKDDAIVYLMKQKPKSSDVIIMQNSLYAIDNREELWKQLRRVISDDGRIIISNSDTAGSKTIIKEHRENDSFIKLLHPKLLLVGLIDMFISQFSETGVFSFLSEDQIKQETKRYFDMSPVERVYGDVNILFILTPR